MARLLLTLAVASLVLGMAAACITSCPPYYEKVVDSTRECGFYCRTAAKPNCLPQPVYNVRTKTWSAPNPSQVTAAQAKAYQARDCGGSSGSSCPSIACAFSSSWAISGPLGCATALSYLKSVANSDDQYSPKQDIQYALKKYTDAGCVNGFSEANLAAYTVAAANAVAKAAASALTYYSMYACTCCLGNSQAMDQVKGAAQAVATAQASALAAAAAEVTDCQGNTLSISPAQTEAYAEAVELAITAAANQLTANNGQCTTSGLLGTLANAVAKASACAVASVYASATSSYTAGDATACVNSMSFSGDGWTQTCGLYVCF